MQKDERAFVIEGNGLKAFWSYDGDPEEALADFRDTFSEYPDGLTIREVAKLQPASLVEAMEEAVAEIQHLIRPSWDGTSTKVFDKDAFEADNCEPDFEAVFDSMVSCAKETFIRRAREAYQKLELSTIK